MKTPPSHLDDWSYEAISYLLESHCFEDARFDWKREFPRDQKGKDRLVREAVAMANNGGGFIIFGVSDQEISPPSKRICGVPPDKEFATHLQGQLKRADPPVPFQLRNPPITIPDSDSTLQVAQILSISAPHSFDHIFYRRTSGGSAEPMKTHGVQELFVRWSAAIREAPILQHLRQLRHKLYRSTTWEELSRDVESLGWYAFEGGPNVRREILEALTAPLTGVRRGMPGCLAHEVSTVVLRVLVRGPESRQETEQGILLLAVEHGFALAYDGGLYLRSGPVVWAGAEVLAEVLTIAHQNDLPQVKARALERFEDAIKAAARATPGPFHDAIEWLQHKKAYAIAKAQGIGSVPEPDSALHYRMVTDAEIQERPGIWKRRLRSIMRRVRL